MVQKEQIFYEWTPKLQFDESFPHPSKVYETENMKSTLLPDIQIQSTIKRKLCITHSQKIEKYEYISDVQLEAISYCVHNFFDKHLILTKKRGFLLGDGTGVGKTRTIAGVIAQTSSNFKDMNKSFRCIWISTNTILEKNASEEMNIMKDNNKIFPKLIKFRNIKKPVDEDHLVTYITYSSLTRENNYKKIINWLQLSDENLIIFDESHTAKNANSLTGKMVINLQNELKNPCVIYSTATAASDLKQIHYMIKLDIWKNNYNDFVKKLDRFGSTTLELIAIQLKIDGKMVSRHLGLQDIVIKIKQCNLNEDEKVYYNELCKRWRTQSNDSIFDSSTNFDGLVFYRNLITHFKVRHLIKLIEDSLLNEESVVIGIQSTGEIAQKRNESSLLKDKFIQKNIDINGLDFPFNPIDIIIQYFGKNIVSEISGRTMRPHIINNEIIGYENVPEPNQEIKSFQNNEKSIIIITKAGSAGISLHCELHSSVRRRHHIILETPWSAESLLQQIGRTHRTNSELPPYYTIMVSNVPAEFRFFNGLSRKLENLGALTKGDKRATIFEGLTFRGCQMLSEENFSNFHFEFNLNISRYWYNQNKNVFLQILKNKNLTNVLKGLNLYLHTLRFNHESKLKSVYNKILQKLNLRIIDYYANDENDQSIADSNLSINLSCNEWKNIWSNITELNDIIYLTKKIDIFTLYYCCWKNIKTYIKDSDYFFADLTEWKSEYSKYTFVSEKLKVLLLCKNKPECSNTIGLLPNHLISDIMSWLFKRNDLSKIQWRSLYKDEHINIPKQIISNSYSLFFNNLFNFPLEYQEYIFNCMFESSNEYSNNNCNEILDLDTYILKNKVNSNIILKYDSVRYEQDFLKFRVSYECKIKQENIEYQYDSWLENNKIDCFIQDKKNKNKFGILIHSSNSKWDKEIWYPCEEKPSICFNKFQWEMKKNSYNILDVNKDKWLEYSNVIIRRFNLKYSKKHSHFQIVQKNIIYHWMDSQRKILKINIKGINDDKTFLGLLYRKW